MAKYKSIIVTVSGRMEAQFAEIETPQLEAALKDGYIIEDVHQVASNPSASSTTSSQGMVVITYVLKKG